MKYLVGGQRRRKRLEEEFGRDRRRSRSRRSILCSVRLGSIVGHVDGVGASKEVIGLEQQRHSTLQIIALLGLLRLQRLV